MRFSNTVKYRNFKYIKLYRLGKGVSNKLKKGYLFIASVYEHRTPKIVFILFILK